MKRKDDDQAHGRNLRLLVEVDGRRFAGWNARPGERLISSVLADALGPVLGHPVHLNSALSLEAGAHAEGLIVNARTGSVLAAPLVHERVEKQLPPDVAVVSVEEVAEDFHARHSVGLMHLRYQVARRRTPFLRWRAWLVAEPLDLDEMERAADVLPGVRDLAAFCDRRSARKGGSARVERVAIEASGPLLCVRLVADRLPPRAARRLVAALVSVGRGDIQAGTVSGWLETRTPGAAGRPAPSAGLFLERVELGARDRHALAPTARRAVDALDAAGGGHRD